MRQNHNNELIHTYTGKTQLRLFFAPKGGVSIRRHDVCALYEGVKDMCHLKTLYFDTILLSGGTNL